MAPTGKTVLIVEDDMAIRTASAFVLSAAGYRVLESDTIAVGLHLFQTQQPDIVLVDVGLPDGSGMDLCRKVRASKKLSATPVIILTAQGQFESKSAGFEAGADQYLVKPVPPQEVLLWVQALLKRVDFDQGKGKALEAGDLVIEPEAHLVRYRDVAISNLTVKEFDLLYFLVRNRPKVLSRQHILSNLWHTVAVDKLVDAHMGNLRSKLPQELADKLQAVPGKGFRYFG
ncbi:MAG: response regulator transcription factor [Elusimicrobia bacterium]|nr:response regulator transcription factor [Elusimicrobiota bacterium]